MFEVAEGHMRYQASACEMCGGWNGIGTDFPVSIILPMLEANLHLHFFKLMVPCIIVHIEYKSN